MYPVYGPYMQKEQPVVKYQFCIDCGKRKIYNTFRNCMDCRNDVIAYRYFDKCKRCGKPKKENIEGLCRECQEEIYKLNEEARLQHNEMQ